jgi:hypothetical protein
MRESPKSFEGIGLPKAHAYPQLAFHEPTQTLIAHTRPLKSRLPGDRLSFRQVGGSRYQPIGSFTEGISIDSFVIDPTRPALYFSTLAWEIGEAGPTGNWDGLFRFDLAEHRCEELARRGRLRAPDGDGETWLSELLAVSNDGEALICNAPRGDLQRSPRYWLMRLELANLVLTPMTELEAVFA